MLDIKTYHCNIDNSTLLQYDINMENSELKIKTFKKPLRIFEKSGTVIPENSYYVFLEGVVNTDGQDIKTMIDRGRYFSMFAARQSGKTTFLESTRRQLHLDKTYIVILLSFQKYKNVEKEIFYSLVQDDIYTQLSRRLKEIGCDKLDSVSGFLEKHRIKDHISFTVLFEELNRILLFKKIVILIDEFDGIPQNELENFLSSLRDLYLKYKSEKQKALYSVGLIGIRNIAKLVVGGVSPFNIADHVKLPPFSLQNVRDLYAQYTEETNQPFTEEAVKKIYEETAGQPWLVNRLGTILTVDVKPGTIDPIDTTDVEKAIRILLFERNDHFDNLLEKVKLYKETFVEIVFDGVEYDPNDANHSWLEQYGLIKNRDEHAVVSNNIYKNRFLKTFFKEVSASVDPQVRKYILPGDRLNIEKILSDFSRYIGQIGAKAFYQKENPYERTGQFLLTAWLYQFVKDGEGELRYEVPSGLGRMDILLVYKGTRYIIETKVKRFESLETLLKEGVEQVSGSYLQPENVEEGYLVIFDIKTRVGNEFQPRYFPVGTRRITAVVIGIGKR